MEFGARGRVWHCARVGRRGRLHGHRGKLLERRHKRVQELDVDSHRRVVYRRVRRLLVGVTAIVAIAGGRKRVLWGRKLMVGVVVQRRGQKVVCLVEAEVKRCEIRPGHVVRGRLGAVARPNQSC